MLTVYCVLRSGGIYTAEWVGKLARGCHKNMTFPHEFVCLTDDPAGVPCKTISLRHDWPGWWSKLELFRPGVVKPPALYLDLDTAIVGSLDAFANLKYDFAMLRNFHRSHMFGSGVMWFGKPAPFVVYSKFKTDPAGWIDYHDQRGNGPYVGDQAFISDTLDDVRCIQDGLPTGAIVSYKKHCAAGLPQGASVVAFGGRPKPFEVNDAWVQEAWA